MLILGGTCCLDPVVSYSPCATHTRLRPGSAGLRKIHVVCQLSCLATLLCEQCGIKWHSPACPEHCCLALTGRAPNVRL
jgi:hypothetical protein